MEKNTMSGDTSSYAYPLQRLGAFLIDSVCGSMILVIYFFLIHPRINSGQIPDIIVDIVALLVILITLFNALFVSIVLPTITNGFTFGKAIMRIQIQHREGTELTFLHFAGREVMRSIFSSVFPLLPYFTMYVHPYQAIHDKVVNTVVCEVKETSQDYWWSKVVLPFTVYLVINLCTVVIIYLVYLFLYQMYYS